MAQIDRAFEVENGISFDDEILIHYTATDPTSGGGYEAPKGSLLLQKPAAGDAKMWLKTGDGNTAWSDISEGGSGNDTQDHQYKVTAGNTITIDAGRQFDHNGRFQVDGRKIIDGRFVFGMVKNHG